MYNNYFSVFFVFSLLIFFWLLLLLFICEIKFMSAIIFCTLFGLFPIRDDIIPKMFPELLGIVEAWLFIIGERFESSCIMFAFALISKLLLLFCAFAWLFVLFCIIFKRFGFFIRNDKSSNSFTVFTSQKYDDKYDIDLCCFWNLYV